MGPAVKFCLFLSVKAWIYMKAVFWLGIMFNANISVTFQAIKDLYARFIYVLVRFVNFLVHDC